eukprot:scaffold38615_cov155-Skeletonema_dohrnii-CCMP3373.AAC.1
MKIRGADIDICEEKSLPVNLQRAFYAEHVFLKPQVCLELREATDEDWIEVNSFSTSILPLYNTPALLCTPSVTSKYKFLLLLTY